MGDQGAEEPIEKFAYRKRRRQEDRNGGAGLLSGHKRRVVSPCSDSGVELHQSGLRCGA